jgi:thiamine biosynthesis lipoprotein
MLATTSFPALGTTAVVVVTEEQALAAAREAVAAEIAAVDAACSRFRRDSELSALNRAGERPVPVSATLFGAVDAALQVAAATGGLVDPTVGRALRVLGYDRDFAEVDRQGPPLRIRVGSVPGWQVVRLDRAARRITVPTRVEMDLGATAKAWCADRAADRAARARPGVGVLVGLGGDIAVAGPGPEQGWVIRLADRHDAPPDRDDPTVVIRAGGLATSSTTRRRWQRGGDVLHHLLDPRTGRPTEPFWRTVSVAAASCVGANAASTAAIVLGPHAVGWLEARRLPARLVSEAGEVATVADWPGDERTPTARRDAVVGRR